MLSRLFKRSPVQSTAGASETLDLANALHLRVIAMPAPLGYAALAHTGQGVFIINRHDTGVGRQLQDYGAYDPEEMDNLRQMVSSVPADPVILDIGANIGVTSLVLAQAAGPRGLVHAFEAQRSLFHMLAGNMALNSIDNVHCHFQAVGATAGFASIPRIDYRSAASFGSLQLNSALQVDAGQQAQGGVFDQVPMDSIDALRLERVDVVKIDVEGMEADVLAGALHTLRRHRPLMYIEYIKSDKLDLWQTLRGLDYQVYDFGKDFVCFPAGHPAIGDLPGEMRVWTPETDTNPSKGLPRGSSKQAPASR